MSKTIDEIISECEVIKNETEQGANTAERVGGAMGDLAEKVAEKTAAITDLQDEVNSQSVRVNDVSAKVNNIEGGITENYTYIYNISQDKSMYPSDCYYVFFTQIPVAGQNTIDGIYVFTNNATTDNVCVIATYDADNSALTVTHKFSIADIAVGDNYILFDNPITIDGEFYIGISNKCAYKKSGTMNNIYKLKSLGEPSRLKNAEIGQSYEIEQSFTSNTSVFPFSVSYKITELDRKATDAYNKINNLDGGISQEYKYLYDVSRDMSLYEKTAGGYFFTPIKTDGENRIDGFYIHTENATTDNVCVIATYDADNSALTVTHKFSIADIAVGDNYILFDNPITIDGEFYIGISNKCVYKTVGQKDTVYKLTGLSTLDAAVIGQSYAIAQSVSANMAVFPFAIKYTINSITEWASKVIGRLANKNIIAIGDSMVKGHSLSNENTWLYMIADRNNMTYSNRGTNGAFMTNKQYGSKDNSVYQKVCVSDSEFYISDDDISNADFIIVYAGTNDCNSSITIGDITSTDPTEFCGAINLICDNLQTRAPKAHIGFITPQIRSGYDTTLGQRCISFCDAIKSVCKKYSIPVYGQAEECGINWANTAIRETLTLNDGYHPNAVGNEFLSWKYEEFLKGI